MAATKDVVKRDLLIPRNPVRSMRYRADRHRTHVSNNTEGALGGPDVAFELLLETGLGGRRARHRSVERGFQQHAPASAPVQHDRTDYSRFLQLSRAIAGGLL